MRAWRRRYVSIAVREWSCCSGAMTACVGYVKFMLLLTEIQAPSTSNSTSSSTTQPQSSEVANYLADLGTGKAEEALSWKPSSIAQSQKPESQDLGSMESLTPDRAPVPTSTRLRRSYSQVRQSRQSQHQPRRLSSSTTEGSSDSQVFKRQRDFEASASSSSSGRQVQGKLPLSTKRLGTPTFTVWQAKSLSGSMGMTDSVFSSLTTLRARLGAKHSFDTWTDIHSNFQSKAALQSLATVLSLCAPTTKKTTQHRHYEEYTQVESSGSSDSEESIQISSSSCEEEDSDQEDSIDLRDEDEPCEYWPRSILRTKQARFNPDQDY